MTDASNSTGQPWPDSPWLGVWRADEQRAADEQAARAARAAHKPGPREPLRPGALGPWWRAGWRAALGRRPDAGQLAGLQATPAVMACLLLSNVLAQVAWERLAIHGPAQFYWQGLLDNWLTILVLVWLCAWVRPVRPGVAHLICLVLSIEFAIIHALGAAWALMARAGGPPGGGSWWPWIWWGLPQLWWLAAMGAVLWRLGDGHWRAWLGALLLMLGLLALHAAGPSSSVWYPVSTQDEAERPRLRLTDAVLEQQPQLLARQLAALKPQRPGVVDVYVLTFAPYGDEDVFSRESAMVAEVMGQRFDAQGRVLQLVNHPGMAEQLPWATPGHLTRALAHIGKVMDPREDVLFIHLTSHGARNGRLATHLWPLDIAELTPRALKAALDEAGIRHRVLSISACFSGSWIGPLADADSLVMTAADADHTSYGCGRLSPLTFFGRAMYDELLRSQTLSFTEAHARARELIRQREQAAGKDDGYSNPQIRQGERIGPRLEALRQRLIKAGTAARPASPR